MAYLILTIAAIVPVGATEAQLPTDLDLTELRALPVQHDGRWMPLDTVARDTVKSITGTTHHNGIDPVLMLLAWTFDAPTWGEQPLITIANAELRKELGLSPSQTVFTYATLREHRPLIALIHGLRDVRGRKLDPLEKKAQSIFTKLQNLSDVFAGQVIRPIPDPNEASGRWAPLSSEAVMQRDDCRDTLAAWRDMREAFLARDTQRFNATNKTFVAALAKLPAEYRPAPSLIATELQYNQTAPFTRAWEILSAAAVLAFLALLLRHRAADLVTLLVMIAGFLALTWGLYLRWQIAGRIPAANMFESLLFLSWGASAFAIISTLVFHQRVIPLTASGLGAVALILADNLPLDGFIRPIPPVLLDTIWMSIHVPVIMVSYAVLALAVIIAHVELIALALAARKREFIDAVDRLHYWFIHVGSILLFVGIFTGSMWASSSWGRYWGWDPKEVWSLIAFLCYLVTLHERREHGRRSGWRLLLGPVLTAIVLVLVGSQFAHLSGAMLIGLVVAGLIVLFFVLARGHMAVVVKSIVSFWMIVMTYVGVNYVLGIGLHTYGFGTGAVVHYMFLLGSLDLALVVACYALHLLLRPKTAVAAAA